MPESPLYAESTAAGRADHLLRHVTNGFSDYQDGNVEAPTGWFTAVLVDSTDVAHYVSEHGDPWVSEHRNFPCGYYLIQINNDGLIWGHYYGPPRINPMTCRPRRRMLADFNRLCRIYREWCGPDIGDDDWTRDTVHRYIEYGESI